MKTDNYIIARKPLPSTYAPHKIQLAHAEHTRGEVRGLWVKYYAEQGTRGHARVTDKLYDAMEHHAHMVVRAAHSALSQPGQTSLKGITKQLGFRLALGARAGLRVAAGITGATIAGCAVLCTLGVASYSERLNARVRFALVYGCFEGARADAQRMVLPADAGIVARFAHKSERDRRLGELDGLYAPLLEGVRPEG